MSSAALYSLTQQFLLGTVLFGVMLCGFFRMVIGMQVVSMRDVGMMPSLFMAPGGVFRAKILGPTISTRSVKLILVTSNSGTDNRQQGTKNLLYDCMVGGHSDSRSQGVSWEPISVSSAN